MARRRLLGDDLWAIDLKPSTDKREDASCLGFALVNPYLRHPGRLLETGELPPGPMIANVAHLDAARRDHVAEIMRAREYSIFNRAAMHGVVAFLNVAAQIIV